jgi:hypothetical protein
MGVRDRRRGHPVHRARGAGNRHRFHGFALETAVDLAARALRPFRACVVIVAIRLLEMRGEAQAPAEMADALHGEREGDPA